MLTWAKEHWYYVVGALIGLYVVYLLMTRSSSAAASSAGTVAQTSTADPNVIAANAALQTAQLQLNQQTAAYQTAAATQVQTSTLQLQQQQDLDAANVAMNTSSNNAAVAINQSNNHATILGNQYAMNVALAQNQTAQQLGLAQVAASVTENHDNNNAAITQVQYNDAAAVAMQNNLDSTNLQAILSNNATALGEYTIQGNVANNLISTSGNVDLASIAAQESTAADYYATASQIAASQIAVQQKEFNTAANIISSGTLNKGGSGGTNQVAAFNALLSPNSASAGDIASAQATVGTANLVPNTISAVGGAVAQVLGSSSTSTTASGATRSTGLSTIFG